MINILLLKLLEKTLGKSETKTKGNYSFRCINKQCNSLKKGYKKLEINTITDIENNNKWNCWDCGVRGKKIKTLFDYIKIDNENYDELNKILGTCYKQNIIPLDKKVNLPEEFISFIDLKKTNIISKHALKYLIKDRGITFEDIIKCNIGFCEYGEYKNKIIIPSYSLEGILEYFVARDFMDSSYNKISASKSSKDIIGFESLINWNNPITICEGAFDAIAIKRNAIPLFGKNISNKLKKRIYCNDVKKIYLSLDNDALLNTFDITKKLIEMGKEVYVVRLDKKDPSELGFEKFTKLLHNVRPFTFSDLLKLKMELKKI